MVDMVIRKSRHGVVTVVIVGLVADLDALDAGLGGGLFEVLREELALFVEVVAGALFFFFLSTHTPIGLGGFGGNGEGKGSEEGER